MTIVTATGRADPAAPFAAFGPLGSVLEIDHPVLHESPLARIEVDLDWEDFPPRGLRHWYRGYRFDPPIANARFGVTISAPLAGWREGRVRRLFAANGVSRFVLAKGRGEAGQGPLRITLAEPHEAFGETGYAEAVMAAAAQRAGRLPNVPWRPVVSRFALRVLPA